MTRANPLRELQQTDTKRDEIHVKLAKVAAALRSDGGVANAREAAAAADAALASIEQELRRRSLERQTAKDHVAREEKQLYGGKVRVAKELQNLQMEVAALRRQLKQMDDEALDLMIQRDEAEEVAQQSRDALAQKQTAAVGYHNALKSRQASFEEELRRLDTHREAVSATIAPGDLQMYERLRKAKGGRAVADLNDGSCSACGVLLPQKYASRARSGESVRCDGCGRIVLA